VRKINLVVQAMQGEALSGGEVLHGVDGGLLPNRKGPRCNICTERPSLSLMISTSATAESFPLARSFAMAPDRSVAVMKSGVRMRSVQFQDPAGGAARAPRVSSRCRFAVADDGEVRGRGGVDQDRLFRSHVFRFVFRVESIPV
jgi:hypothetical protein